MGYIIWSLVSVLVVSLVSLIGALVLTLHRHMLDRTLMVLVSLAAGALLGDAFIHLIPESFATLNGQLSGPLLVIGGMLIFFVLEKILHWHHRHQEGAKEFIDCEDDHRHQQVKPLAYTIIFSDGLHNVLDGIIIGAGYLVSFEVGLATTVAVLLHEIPQEIGDFGVLIHSGMSKTKALLYNFLSAMAAFVGVASVLILGSAAEIIQIWLLPIAAGGFIYIAASDLIPELHKSHKWQVSLAQSIALMVGVAVMVGLLYFE